MQTLPARGVRTDNLLLVGFPHLAGNSSIFHGWRRSLPPEAHVLGAVLPGRGSRLAEPLLTDVRAMAEDFVLRHRDALAARVILYGHSMGALLAYEVAHLLTSVGAPPAALIVAGSPGPTVIPVGGRLHLAEDGVLVDYLQRHAGTPRDVLASGELVSALLPVVRADLEALETYQYRPRAPLGLPLTAIVGSSDPDAPASLARTWRTETTGPFVLERLDGGHFFPLTNRPELLSIVTRVVRQALEEGASRASATVPR